MTGDYPRFKASYTHEELVEHFLLSPAEHALVDTCRGDVNRHGVAVLLKAVQYLGYFPDDLQQVPEAVRTFIAHQLQLLWDHTADYPGIQYPRYPPGADSTAYRLPFSHRPGQARVGDLAPPHGAPKPHGRRPV